MRIDRNRPDLLVEMEWFFCKPGAKIFPHPTAFSSRNYTETNEQADLSLGEVEVTNRWVRGDPPTFANGQGFCGNLASFTNGSDLVHGPIQARDSQGMLTCCGGPFFAGWTFTTAGGPTWITLTAYHIRIEWEDSENCGGSNSNIQTGTADLTLDSDTDQTVTVLLNARIETENEGFDGIVVFLNGAEVYRHFSTIEGGGCTMEDFSDTLTLDLVAGLNEIRVEFDTVDGLFHVGGFWDLDFLLP